MRGMLLFIMTIAMLSAGLYCIGFEVFWAAHVRSILLAGGVFLALLGGYLLWIDFIEPSLGVKTGRNSCHADVRKKAIGRTIPVSMVTGFVL